MNNLFCTGLKIDKRYDLKGSTLGRITNHEKDKPIDTSIALKDLNFLNEKEKFIIGHENKERLIQIMKKDAEFFAEVGIIDYSLLIGVHDYVKHKKIH